MHIKGSALLVLGLCVFGCGNSSSEFIEEVGQEQSALESRCTAVNVPISLTDVPTGHIYGELCAPEGADTVELLVHTTWHNGREWDPPGENLEPYSYVRAANSAGLATFNIDRFGTGRSTKPASNLVTIANLVDALHQVTQALRSGAVAGRSFKKVVWVGSSFGSLYGWKTAEKYPADIDVYVFMGLSHTTKTSFLNIVTQDFVSVCEDPIFSTQGMDCGYTSNRLGTKGELYFVPKFTPPGILDGADIEDNYLRDVVSITLLLESTQYTGANFGPPPSSFIPDPATSPSRTVHVPSLIVMGDLDNINCAPPDGIDCSTPESLLAFEQPFYSIRPDVYIAKNAGHSVTLHFSGPQTNRAVNAWIHSKVR